MSTVYEEESKIAETSNNEPMGDEDFFVLKFPHKLWRIVNECNTGAIQWGTYGKTILIDYNLFQSQYLECETPKFKTRNMTSFVRQLNMYGFKKMQTQVKNDVYRCCNIHEFFHNCFRYGRYDLLDSVKRRPTPVKSTRYLRNTHDYHNQSRLQMCRAAFAKALQKSKDKAHQGNHFTTVENIIKDETSIDDTEYTYEVIPVENSLKEYLANGTDKSITVEVNAQYQDYVAMNPEEGGSEAAETESSSNEVDEGQYEGETIELTDTQEALRYLEQASLTDDNLLDLYWALRGNHSLQVKKGFDGANYVIDLTVEDEEVNMDEYDGGAELYNLTEEDDEANMEDDSCMIVVNGDRPAVTVEKEESHPGHQQGEPEEFYDSITKTYLRL